MVWYYNDEYLSTGLAGFYLLTLYLSFSSSPLFSLLSSLFLYLSLSSLSFFCFSRPFLFLFLSPSLSLFSLSLSSLPLSLFSLSLSLSLFSIFSLSLSIFSTFSLSISLSPSPLRHSLPLFSLLLSLTRACIQRFSLCNPFVSPTKRRLRIYPFFIAPQA